MRMALEYWMMASRYLAPAKYFSPLSKYFCLRTLGSREQPDSSAARSRQGISRRIREGRLILRFSGRGGICGQIILCCSIILQDAVGESYRGHGFRLGMHPRRLEPPRAAVRTGLRPAF